MSCLFRADRLPAASTALRMRCPYVAVALQEIANSILNMAALATEVIDRAMAKGNTASGTKIT